MERMVQTVLANHSLSIELRNLWLTRRSPHRLGIAWELLCFESFWLPMTQNLFRSV